MSIGEIVEYYFDNYYRVIVVESSSEYVVSVDVYLANWVFTDHREICIENTCLLVKELTLEDTRYPCRPSRVTILGSRLGSRVETIGVKWVCREKPSRDQVESLYNISWRLVQSGKLS